MWLIISIVGILVAAGIFAHAMGKAAALGDEQMDNCYAELKQNRDERLHGLYDQDAASSDFRAGRISEETFDQFVQAGPDVWLDEPYVHRPEIPFWLDDADLDDERAVKDWPLPRHFADPDPDDIERKWS